MNDIPARILIGTLILLGLLVAFSRPALSQQIPCEDSLVVMVHHYHWGRIPVETRRVTDDDGKPIKWTLWHNRSSGSWAVTLTKGRRTCFGISRSSGYAGQTLADILDDET